MWRRRHLRNGDLLATLAVEATVHHADLVAGDESLADPCELGLAVAWERLDGALGELVPVDWDDRCVHHVSPLSQRP